MKRSNYEKGNCPRCGVEIIANMPFIDGYLRGYKSIDHGCGEEVTLVVITLNEKQTAELFDEEE